MLRAALPGVAGLVFMLCVTSFTIVLTLGGGPAATTLEVAIYQALRFDFDPARAVALTVWPDRADRRSSFWLLTRLGADPARDANLGGRAAPLLSVGRAEKAGERRADRCWPSLFVIGPMAAIVAAGLAADLARLAGEASVRQRRPDQPRLRRAVGA